MRRRAVDDQEYLAGNVVEQLGQVLDERLAGQSLVHEGEKHLSLRTDGGDHIDRHPVSAALDDRRAADRAPCGSGVVVGPHSGLVAEEDARTCGNGLLLDTGVLLFLPCPHLFGVLFIGPDDRALRRQSHSAQEIPDSLRGVADTEFPLDQISDDLPRPQGEFEAVPPGVTPDDPVVQPAPFVIRELRRRSGRRVPHVRGRYSGTDDQCC